MNHLDSSRRAEEEWGWGGHIVGPGCLLCGAASLAAAGPAEVDAQMARGKQDATETGREAEENHQSARQHAFRFYSTTETTLGG